MNSPNTQRAKAEISVSNIIAEVELLLRRYKKINDNEVVNNLTFGEINNGVVVVTYDKTKEG